MEAKLIRKNIAGVGHSHPREGLQLEFGNEADSEKNIASVVHSHRKEGLQVDFGNEADSEKHSRRCTFAPQRGFAGAVWKRNWIGKT